jgi:hypothetical protein
VLEGAISSQVNDGPVRTYDVGQSFYETSADHDEAQAVGTRDPIQRRVGGLEALKAVGLHLCTRA